MANVRMLPPAVASSPVTRHARTYNPAAGAFQDVPDFDAKTLEANGWTRIGLVGPTSARPSPAQRSLQFLDTTLGLIVIFDGAVWRNPATGAAA